MTCEKNCTDVVSIQASLSLSRTQPQFENKLPKQNKETITMQTNFRGRDFIGDLDFTKEEVETVLDIAWDLKRKRALGEPHAYLRDKVLAMLFFFSSTRTRGSFEAGIAQLGGHGAFIDSATRRIPLGDTRVVVGEFCGRYWAGIALRHSDLGA